jgi:hypothetical protein
VVPTPRTLIEVPCVSVCDDWMLKLGEIDARWAPLKTYGI